MRRYVLSAVLLCALAPAALGATPSPAEGKLSVFVAVPPQALFAERVGGEHVAVRVLVGAGQDPHVFEPTPKQVVELSRADLYLRVGVPLERRLVPRIERTGVKVIDTIAGIERRMMEEEHGHHHEHAHHEAEHGHGHHDDGHEDEEEDDELADPHVWLSPPLIAVQARNMAEAFIAADPAHEADYRRNLDTFLEELDAVHEQIRQMLAPYRGESFYVFHPAFGYFADAYGLEQRAVEVAGKSPTAKQLAGLIARARAEGVRVIFVQPQFDPRAAASVAAAIDGAVVALDPLARDVLGNLREMADKIEQALKG